MQQLNKDDILAIECKHAVHCPTPKYLLGQTSDDFHFIKEVIHLKDGTRIPNKRLVKNYQRDFYITKPGFRNHKQKKETEDLNKLQKFSCNETSLPGRIIQSLELYHMGGQSLRRIFRSPYIYGAEVSSTTLIKQHYLNHLAKLNIAPAPYTVAGLDIETSMETGAILMGTVSFKSDVQLFVDRAFLKGISDPARRIHEVFDKYCAEVKKARNIDLKVHLVNSPAEVLTGMINKLHDWQPDFCSIWNIDFELNRFLETAERYNMNLAELMSDKSVPKPFRHFYYKEGQRQKKTSSGKFSPKSPEEQWHSVITPASFQFVDAMAAYNFNRTGQQKKRSYSLASILDEENTGIQKLNFSYIETKTEDTGDWHILMQEDYPIEYCVYNVMDPIVLEVLDEKTKDLATILPTFLGASDLPNYSSQPKRKIDDWHFEFLELGKVIGTTSDQMKDPLDEEIFGLDGWIITLSALNEETGLKIIEELPDLATNIRLFAGDLDISSSYPSSTSNLNISKRTTRAEVISVEGKSETLTRMQGLNLSGGFSNSTEFCTKMLNMPDSVSLLDMYKESLKKA